MCTFVDDLFFDTRETIEYNGATPAFHIVYGGLDEGDAYGERDSVFVDGWQGVRHGRGE